MQGVIIQLESEGMKNFMKELKPKSLEDISRDFPVPPRSYGFYPQVHQRKKSPGDDHLRLSPAGGNPDQPHGCAVYQEQVMQIVRSLGGYTLGRSDLVRRAMSKKKASVMEQERKNFVLGIPRKGFRAASPGELMRRRPIRFTMICWILPSMRLINLTRQPMRWFPIRLPG